jgi:hypothetical protein
MIWRFNSVYNRRRQHHFQDVRYELPPPPQHHVGPRERAELYIHHRAAVGDA